jgi:hypothetical protein
MKVGAMRMALLGAAFWLGAFHGQVLAHGGLSMDKDVCKLQLGRFAMHFTGYQPQATGSREFCEDIPELGVTVVALDAIDDQLRQMPIAVRIFQDLENSSDSTATTILEIQAKVYPTGSISFEHSFDKPGKFIGLVTAGEKGEYVSRFPFSVGVVRPAYEKFLLLLAVPFLGMGLYWFSGRARRKAELSSAKES